MTYELQGFQTLDEAILQFHPSDSTKTDRSPVRGILKHGAYTQDSTPLRIAILAPSQSRRELESTVRLLNDGHRTFAGGMPAIFHCPIQIVDAVNLDWSTASAITASCDRLAGRQNGQSIDVVIANVPIMPRTNMRAPYNQLKAYLAVLGFPSPMISAATMNNPTWKLLNLGLGIFAKAGRIPWVLRDEMPGVDALIGIDMSHPVLIDRQNSRYVAFVNVFDSYGRWQFMEGSTEAVRFEERHVAIDSMLRSTISRYVGRLDRSPSAVAIHYFKRISHLERDVILGAIWSIAPDCSIALINIDDSHGIRLYDSANSSTEVGRGQAAILSDSEMVLSTTGHSPDRRSRMGTPVLLKIKAQQFPKTFLRAR